MGQGDTPQSGDHDEAVILVPGAAGFLIVHQFEVAFLEPDPVGREWTVVWHLVDDAVDDAAFPDEVPLAGEDFPAEPNFEDDRSVLVHRRYSACCLAVRPIATRPAVSSKLRPGASEPYRPTMPVKQERFIDDL